MSRTLARIRTTPPALRVASWGGGIDSTPMILLSLHGEFRYAGGYEAWCALIQQEG